MSGYTHGKHVSTQLPQGLIIMKSGHIDKKKNKSLPTVLLIHESTNNVSGIKSPSTFPT